MRFKLFESTAQLLNKIVEHIFMIYESNHPREHSCDVCVGSAWLMIQNRAMYFKVPNFYNSVKSDKCCELVVLLPLISGRPCL